MNASKHDPRENISRAYELASLLHVTMLAAENETSGGDQPTRDDCIARTLELAERMAWELTDQVDFMEQEAEA